MDAGNVRECYRQLKEVLEKLTQNYEIIYVNDASPDNAEDILNDIAANDKKVVIVNHTRNFGSQNAFLSGMRVSRGDAVVLMDGDLQDPPHIIKNFVEKWLDGYDIVYGIRIKRKETLFRQIAYKVFYRIFQKLADFHIPLDAGDFGLISRRVVNALLSDFPENLVFLRGLRAYTGFKDAGVKYVRQPRFDGLSTNSLGSNLRWAKLAIFSFSHKPLEYISLAAMLCVLLTGAAAVFWLGSYFLSKIIGNQQPPPGYMTQLLLMLFFGSVQLICFSILAEYLGHIYNEVKRRPRYFVRHIEDKRDEKNGTKVITTGHRANKSEFEE